MHPRARQTEETNKFVLAPKRLTANPYNRAEAPETREKVLTINVALADDTPLSIRWGAW